MERLARAGGDNGRQDGGLRAGRVSKVTKCIFETIRRTLKGDVGKGRGKERKIGGREVSPREGSDMGMCRVSSEDGRNHLMEWKSFVLINF